MIKPTALKNGDQVAIVSLSSGVLGEDFTSHEVQLGIQRLKEFGLKPVFMNNALKGIDFLREHPGARAADLKQAFITPEIKGIICAIGGDDTYKLIPYLIEDQEFIDAIHQHPKLFTGFSDTTINHLLLNKLDLVTYYGPNLLNDLGELDQGMLPYTKKTFERYFGTNKTTKIGSSPVWYEERTDFSVQAVNTSRVQHPEKYGYLVLRGHGQVAGKLFGGCLDSLGECLMGMRHEDMPEVISKYGLLPGASFWKDKILFIETSEEQPTPEKYRALLEALDQHGILAKVKAIIVGKPQNEVYFKEYQDLLLEVTAPYATPIMYNLNFGHAYPRTALPYGLKATVDFDEKQMVVDEAYFEV